MQTKIKKALMGLGLVAPLALFGMLACQEQSKCGNGFIDKGEQCDDGNFMESDGCTFACTINTRIGTLCFPIPNVQAPKQAGRINCAPSASQQCILCASIGGGITGENATWDRCHPVPNPSNPQYAGLPNCLESQFQRCLPCGGSQQVPGPQGPRTASFKGEINFCGDGVVTPPEVCDPEDSGDDVDEDCLGIDCGLEPDAAAE